MPHRVIVAKELATLLGVLSHPKRIRIVQELRHGELDVNAIQAVLGISHSGVSQHLMLLRVNRVVAERREGRRVFYHLRQPAIATWLAEAMTFLDEETAAVAEVHEAIQRTKVAWTSEDESG